MNFDKKGGAIPMNEKLVLYMSASLLMVSVFIVAAVTFGLSQEVSHVEENIEQLSVIKEDLLANPVSDRNDEADNDEVNIIAKATVPGRISAEKIGDEIVELQNVLAELFCPNNHLTQNIVDMRLEIGPDLGKKLNELTDIDADSYQYATWKMNNNWSLELASVMEYEDIDRFPIVFTMRTEEGDLIGLVKATYHVDEHRLYDIKKYYLGIRNKDGF